jgi:hypothetical protein
MTKLSKHKMLKITVTIAINMKIQYFISKYTSLLTINSIFVPNFIFLPAVDH